jgi:hypothetical protein
MSCPHTETTAVLAAFGEAPDNFDDHLLGCAACQEVVDTHTETLSVIATAAPGLPAPARRSWRPGVTAILLAAAVLLAIQTLSPGVDPAREAIDSPVPETHQVQASLVTSFETSIDSDLSDLELELALMTLE